LIAHKSGIIGLTLVCVIVFGAFSASIISSYDPTAQNISNSLKPPSREHIFGTDELGRDIFSRIFYGARISLFYSCLTVMISVLIGASLGIIAAYYGKWLDEIIMRLTDIFLAFPGILLAVTIVGVLGGDLRNILIANSFFIGPGFVRVARGAALSVQNNEYIEAARSIGASNKTIILSHIIPNCMSPILVQSTLRLGTVILLTAGLSFLGLGPKPPTPEWGLMLGTGRAYLRIAPHVSVIPGGAIMIAVLGFNLLGDALRDVLDPQQ
jgi:peptide/nickel transport system permease protein